MAHDVLDRQQRVTTFDGMKDEPLEALGDAPRTKISAIRSTSIGAVGETVMTDKTRDQRGAETEPHGKDQSQELAELSEQMNNIAERSRHLVAEFLKRQAAGDGVGMAGRTLAALAFSRSFSFFFKARLTALTSSSLSIFERPSMFSS